MKDGGRGRPVTIRDVAVRAQVSKSSVSNVVRGVPNVAPDLRAKVEQAIAELTRRRPPSSPVTILPRSG